MMWFVFRKKTEIVLILIVGAFATKHFEGVCERDASCQKNVETTSERWTNAKRTTRYLLYDVNIGEGFNLRRDVYMRIGTLLSKLRSRSPTYDWTLVLPPWGPLYHWQSTNLSSQTKIPWKMFFDVRSLSLFIPVIEFKDFVLKHGPRIDTIYYLQNYENWDDGHWNEKYEFGECRNPHRYEEVSGKYFGWFWGYLETYAASFHCVSLLGHASTLLPLIREDETAVMIDRAEVVLHDDFGGAEYWKARRSMRFSNDLIKIADEFRRNVLDSTDESDRTVADEDWTKMHRQAGDAVGGPYIAIHLRRRDFLSGRAGDVPSLKKVARELMTLMKRLKVSLVFVATDAPAKEFEELRSYVGDNFVLVKFVAPKEAHEKYMDGGVAIIDQWICAHARYFIGTYESTFSFRIQEEREILGFLPDTTFNRFCGDGTDKCDQPARWRIKYFD